ncbi:hypothetical protein O6H91_07G024000 [Diphasiastrum complanatum]|uniref:Uncharacterized protein n=2 Tax=Diphasiastrum complanatum TaxID=34168 RepID=A0ACC2D3N4_DIPCM|nr:hypothetical protein O6H91_Y287700 [Diphasiastrum complanatum]KAJ7548719.1 hypothetical protein O6H91_07G024000 [Diphasiastrum complanatum]KAJ7548720.1 hypothetical protein O6H91_07G024000 [Diphasiastrum complanatum]
MVFGLSIGEVVLVLGAAVAFFGPKDIPVIARALGRLSGKAVGHVRAARGQLDDIMQRTQVDQVHKDLQETMSQLEAIRHEIRSGMSILHPGPITREVLNSSTTNLFTQQGEKGNDQKSPIGHVDLFGSVHKSIMEERIALKSNHILETSVNMAKDFKVGVPSSVATAPQVMTNISGDKELFILPVSAAMAGLLSSKKGLMTGSNLVLESVEEQKVASQALEFLRQPETLGPRS